MFEAHASTSSSNPRPGQSPSDIINEIAQNGSQEPFCDGQNTLHDELLRQAVEAALDEPPDHQDYEFTIGRTALIGGGAIEASEVTRAAAVLRSVRETAPESLEEPRSPGQQAVGAEHKLRAAQRFLDTSIPVDETGSTLKRREILPPSKLAAVLLDQLVEKNDPIAQAIEQVRHEYKNSLDDSELDRLKQDVIFTAKQDTVAEVYSDYNGKLRKAGEALLRFMLQ